jgi:uncharacterized protein
MRIRTSCRVLTVLGFGLTLAARILAGHAQPSSISLYDEATLSPPAFRNRIRMEHNVRIPMRDGVMLSADIYRPDAPGTFPVILVRTPYSNNSLGALNTGHYQSIFYAERGYAVVQQDVRGRFDADGEFYPFRDEPDDGYDTDEWVGKQPWSSGKIGTMGQSYFGITQLLQAIRGSRYLTAMVPNVTTFDVYDNWMYTGGAFQFGFALPWAVLIDARVNQELSPYDWGTAFKHLPVSTADEATARKIAFYRDWATHPLRDSYWNGISFEKDHDKVAVPSLGISGWYDIFLKGFLQDHIAITREGKTPAARSGKRMLIGPWVHGLNANPVGAVNFGVGAVTDLARVQLRWYDHWLKGVPNGVDTEPPIKIFVMGENYWRTEKEWPLARTSYVKYYLHSGGRANTLHGDGRLDAAAPAAETPDRFVYDPADPVPTLGGNNCCWTHIVPMGPFDQRSAERRDDVLVYQTAPLTEPIEVTGPISAVLYAATSARDTDWTVKLVDVHPDGFAQNLQDGIVRARYRESRMKAAPVEPERTYEYTVDLWATSNVFLPGHRIRVEVSSSNFPRFDRNLNTGEDTPTATRMTKANQTVYHDGQRPSHVVLPVVPRAAPSSARR